MNSVGTYKIYPALCLFFAFALQIQVSLFTDIFNEGLRVGLGDLVLPVLVIFAVISLFKKNSIWPEWQKPFTPWPLAILTALMCFSLFWGWYLQGEISRWALVNKFTGWFVLMAYFGVGAWIAANAGPRNIEIFIRYFVLAFLVVSGLELLKEMIRIVQPDIGYFFRPLEGLMGNRNAYAFCFAAVAGMIVVFGHKQKIIPPFVIYIFWALAPLLIVLNGSRTLILYAFVFLAILAARNLKKTLLIGVPGIVLCAVLFFGFFSAQQKYFYGTSPFKAFYSLYDYVNDPESASAQKSMQSMGNTGRLLIVSTSLQVIQNHPIAGGGLGGALHAQDQILGKKIDIVDNTTLWILTDMGLIGLTAFIACYIMILHTLLKRRKETGELTAAMANSALLMLIAFTFFSVFHEILYTRFLWFILGMALAMPHRPRSTVPVSQD